MKTISSRITFLYQYFIPIIWLIVIGLLISLTDNFDQIIIGIMVVVLPFSLVEIWLITQSDPELIVMDTVIDAGDHLLISYGDLQDCILLTNIIAVNSCRRNSKSKVGSKLINLRLRDKSEKFGSDIYFYPANCLGLSGFGEHPIIKQLKDRVNAAIDN